MRLITWVLGCATCNCLSKRTDGKSHSIALRIAQPRGSSHSYHQFVRVVSVVRGLVGYRPAWAQRMRFCIGALSPAPQVDGWVGTVCLCAESSRKDLHLHSMLGHSLLLARAGFAAGRLCTVGPACAAGSLLVTEVFNCEAGSWLAKRTRSTAVLPLGLLSLVVGQSHSFRPVVCWCVVVVVGGLIDLARAAFVTGRIGHRPAWSQAGFVTGRLGHRPAWFQAGLVTSQLGHGLAWSPWLDAERAFPYRASSPVPQAACWHRLLARVLACAVPSPFAQLAFADECWQWCLLLPVVVQTQGSPKLCT